MKERESHFAVWVGCGPKIWACIKGAVAVLTTLTFQTQVGAALVLSGTATEPILQF